MNITKDMEPRLFARTCTYYTPLVGKLKYTGELDPAGKTRWRAAGYNREALGTPVVINDLDRAYLLRNSVCRQIEDAVTLCVPVIASSWLLEHEQEDPLLEEEMDAIEKLISFVGKVSCTVGIDTEVNEMVYTVKVDLPDNIPMSLLSIVKRKLQFLCENMIVWYSDTAVVTYIVTDKAEGKQGIE